MWVPTPRFIFTPDTFTGDPQVTKIMCTLKRVCKLNVRKLNFFFS
jgi:hypothetical protein